jgi:hypothetical protein
VKLFAQRFFQLRIKKYFTQTVMNSSAEESKSPDNRQTKLFIYVVNKSEHYKGGNTKGIFTSMEEAQAHARFLTDLYCGKTNWTEINPTYWKRGYECITIEVWPVFNSNAEWMKWWDKDL